MEDGRCQVLDAETVYFAGTPQPTDRLPEEATAPEPESENA